MNNNLLKNMDEIKLRIAKNEHISEEDIRQALNEDIKNYLKQKYNKDISFRNEVKTSVHTFIDSKYENFVIEYKKPTVTIGDSQRTQLINYLKDLGQYSWGIITNGKKLEIYTYSFEEEKYVINESLSGTFNEVQFKYICSAIADKENLILTENNINEYLGLESNKNIIRNIYDKLINSTNERTSLFYKEWQKLFNLSEEYDKLDLDKKKNVISFYEELLNKKINTVEKEYKALFSIQTYYSIILKLVLFKIITNKTGESFVKPKFYRDFFENIESNNLYRKYKIMNLIDGDFFSWYLDEFDDEQYEYLFDKIVDVATIETDKINLLFIKYYENIFPFWVRHSMGEYYTPYYLADNVINNSLNMIDKKKKDIKLLDPTCGSGIFIMNAIEKGINNVYGIDINPLAVLTSKINYLINNMNLDKEMEIPIYLGDSTYFPSLCTINDIECYEYQLTTSIHECEVIDFVFSKESVDEPKFFEILDELEVQIKNLNCKKIKEILKSYQSFHYDELAEHYDSLFDTLINLEKKNLDSIWLKIIGNYLKSGSIRNVDCIVGNPPWVRWSNLPEAYKLLIKRNCRIDGIFSNDSNSGGIDLNICALIAFVTIRERLDHNGVLGFIMPDSILFNKSFEGFRNMILPDGEKYYLNKVVRWNDKTEKPFDPVTLDFCEYYFSFNKCNFVDVFERKGNLYKKAFTNPDSFNNHFIVSNEKDSGKIRNVLGTNNYVLRSGISLPKGGFYLLEFSNIVDDNISEFYHYENNGNNLVRSNEKIKLENDIVYPYIKPEDINDNTIEETKYYCIFPYPYGEKEPYSLNDIRTKYPLFYNYFMRADIQNSINTASSYNRRIQHSNFDVGIIRVGEYTYSEWFLATRDNTKSVFSIVGQINTPWGEKKLPIFDGHIKYISRDYNGKPITYKEIKKIFKIFTQPGVKLYIKSSSDSRSISSRLYNDIKID